MREAIRRGPSRGRRGERRWLLGAAGELQPIADRFANGFDDPADFENFFFDPEKASAYLASVASGA